MGLKSRFYPESRFGGYTDVDGTIVFYTRIQALVEPHHVLVDYGCGRGSYDEDDVALRRELRIFKGKVARVIGMDPDKAAQVNPHLDEFHLLQDDRWPLPDGSADVCVCDWVVEHLADPDMFFSEARRVIRPGGYLFIRTPNTWNYIALASRMVPNRLHSKVLTRVQENRKEEDVFPTLYRCNSVGKMRRYLSRHGFDHVVYGYDAEPSYLSFSSLAYWFGTLYARLAPRRLRSALFAFARRV